MLKPRVEYGLHITGDVGNPDWVKVWLRKSWFQVLPVKIHASRLIASTSFHRGTMDESQLLESALLEMLRTLADEMG